MKVPILLTGANGQLGLEWQYFFEKNDIEATALGSSALDITDEGQVDEAFDSLKPAYVINCAAYTKVDDAEDHRDSAFAVNGTGVGHLAKYSAKHSAKLIHYSTDYIFPGKAEHLTKFPDGYREDFPPDPINVYGESKLAGEKALRNETDNYLIIRVAWLCGRFGNNFVKTMLRLGNERDELSVVNDQYGSPSFCSDVVRNSVNLLKQDVSGTFHITSSGITNWYEFASLIFQQSKTDVRLESVGTEAFPTKATRPKFSKLCTDEIERLPGTKIPEWTDGLAELLQQL